MGPRPQKRCETFPNDSERQFCHQSHGACALTLNSYIHKSALRSNGEEEEEEGLVPFDSRFDRAWLKLTHNLVYFIFELVARREFVYVRTQ